jgi:hypothetical protein
MLGEASNKVVVKKALAVGATWIPSERIHGGLPAA